LKGFKGNWTEELFTVHKQITSHPQNLYKLKEYDGDEIKGTFYPQELQKVKTPSKESFWQVEKILKTRKNRHGAVEHLVKWFGYTDKYNSWVSEKDIMSRRRKETAEVAGPRAVLQTYTAKRKTARRANLYKRVCTCADPSLFQGSPKEQHRARCRSSTARPCLALHTPQ